MGQTVDRTFERTLSVTGPVSLDLSTGFGLLRVRPGPDGSVLVRGILRARSTWLPWDNAEERLRQLEANPPVEQRGNEVRAGGDLGNVVLLLDVTAPRDTRVRASVDHGDIRVDGVKGPVDCQGDSGTIEVAGAEAAVRVSVDNGSVQVRNITGRVEVEIDHGDIEALEIGGAVDVSSDSGMIRVSQTTAAPIRAKSDHGSINVRLAKTGGYDVRVRTDHGSVSVPEMERRSGGYSWNEAEGRIRGGGPMVDVETDHGSIEIE